MYSEGAIYLVNILLTIVKMIEYINLLLLLTMFDQLVMSITD